MEITESNAHKIDEESLGYNEGKTEETSLYQYNLYIIRGTKLPNVCTPSISSLHVTLSPPPTIHGTNTQSAMIEYKITIQIGAWNRNPL